MISSENKTENKRHLSSSSSSFDMGSCKTWGTPMGPNIGYSVGYPYQNADDYFSEKTFGRKFGEWEN